MNKPIALEMKGVSKYFGSLAANKDVDLDVYRGEILAILGENGCGKTTLMNMIAGIYYPDSGTIFVNGKEVAIHSPKDAFNHGIGMVHQHFKLVDIFTAAPAKHSHCSLPWTRVISLLPPFLTFNMG